MTKPARYILSIAFCMHDSCVTVADENCVLLHLEGERFFRAKHIRVETPEKMDELVAGALDHLHLTIDDIPEVLLAGFCNRYPVPGTTILGRSFVTSSPATTTITSAPYFCNT